MAAFMLSRSAGAGAGVQQMTADTPAGLWLPLVCLYLHIARSLAGRSS